MLFTISATPLNLIVMKTKFLLPVVVTILFLFNFIDVLGQADSITQKYILIKSAFLKTADSSINNSVLLIEDQEAINQNEKLFNNNNTYGHGCGYDYCIQFWKGSKKANREIHYSPKCERFVNHNDSIRRLLNGYVTQLNTAPTHYIYNLKIAIAATPDHLLQEFAKAGLKPFFLDNNTEHLSSLTFRYKQVTSLKGIVHEHIIEEKIEQNKQDAVGSIEALIKTISTITKVEGQSEISYPLHSLGGGNIIDQAQITLQLANGVNHFEIRELIKELNGELVELTSPENYYVQLVNDNASLDKIKTLMSEYSFVEAAFIYPARE